MNYKDLVQQLTPELVANFKKAMELGRWQDGRVLTAEQREHCMQAIIAYDAVHTPESQRVGYIDRAHKEGDQCDDPQPETLRWQDDS